MTAVDHLFFLLIAVAYPVSSYFGFRKLLRRVQAGEQISPTYLYDMTLRSHWLLFAIGMAIWAASQRPWADLGFSFSLDTRFLVGVGLTVVALALVAMHLKKLAGAGPDDVADLRRQLGRLEFIFPRNGNELNRFYAVSMTAGIVEETLWRGFLFWYLGHFMPLWVAAVASAIGFGLAHAYQGVRNIPSVILVGGVFAALYLITGSLWLPIVLHAVFDMIQGRVVYDIFRRSGVGLSQDAAASR